MSLSKLEQSFALYLISSVLVSAFFRVFKIKKHCQYVFSFIGSMQIVLFCGIDALHFIFLITVATWIVTSLPVKSPRISFVFCLAYRIFFSASKHLGLYRNEKNLANGLMLVATLKMILVAYEVDDYRRRKKDDPNKEQKYRWSGAAELDQEPTATDIVCYMTCFVGLFTGPIFKFKTFCDMVNSPYRPVHEHLKSHAFKVVAATVILFLGFVFLDMKYFTSNKFVEDALFVRLLHVVPVGFTSQMRYVAVWLLGEWICMLLGLGMYPSKTKPSAGKGPTLAIGSKEMEADQTNGPAQYNFKTVENIRPMTVIAELSFWKSLHHWNCCVQWWLAQFIYRSEVLPASLKSLRAMCTLLFSAIWHGIKPGYFICFLPLPYIAFLEECCFYVQRQFVQYKSIKCALRICHWVFVKMFCYASFFVCFSILDYKSIWNFFQQTYFACYLMPVVMLLVNGLVASLCVTWHLVEKKLR